MIGDNARDQVREPPNALLNDRLIRGRALRQNPRH
jgi:hypothetical protein